MIRLGSATNSATNSALLCECDANEQYEMALAMFEHEYQDKAKTE